LSRFFFFEKTLSRIKVVKITFQKPLGHN
jgi:hypothetical protein